MKESHLVETLRKTAVGRSLRRCNVLKYNDSTSANRITLVIAGSWRIIPASERKVESLAADPADGGLCADALAGPDAAEFQRGLRFSVLRRGLFPAESALVASTHDAGDFRLCS